MRLSSELLFERGTKNVLSQQKRLVDLQTQISTGLRVQRPSDDPLSMSTGISAQQGVQQTDQYIRNTVNLRNQLSQVDTAMQSGSEIMQIIKEGMVASGNGILSVSDKKIIADDLRSRLGELVAIANRRDTTGAYLFGGLNETIAPFNDVPPTAVAGDPAFDDPDAFYAYQGDSNNRRIQISVTRAVQNSVPGDALFTDLGSPPTNFFASVQKVVNALESGDNAAIKASVADQMTNVDRLFDQFQLERTKVGARLRELDTVDVLNRNTSVELQNIASEAVSVDYSKAISQISQGQVALEATQRTFVTVSKLSLFQFLQ